jgi:hypothetical protein
MTEPSLPLEPAEPAAPAAAAPEGPPATPPDAPKRTMSMVSLAVLAVAVVGGVAFTSLMMAARPGAHVRAAAAPAAAYNARPAAPGAARTPVVVDSASAPKWTSKHQARWAGTTRKTAVMEVAAERPVAVWNDTVTPLLIVRCMDKRTDVFVYTETAARIEAEDENHTVKIALDDDAASLARRLMTAGTLRFSFTPHNAAPVTAVFNVHGLAEQLKPVAKHCGGLE